MPCVIPGDRVACATCVGFCGTAFEGRSLGWDPEAAVSGFTISGGLCGCQNRGGELAAGFFGMTGAVA